MYNLNFLLNQESAYKLQYISFTCNDYNKETNVLCYGTTEGSIILICTDLLENKQNLRFRKKNITDVPIYSVCWLDDHRIAITFLDVKYVVFDITADKCFVYTILEGEVIFIKRFDENTYYICGRNKCASAFDKRSKSVEMSLVHGNTVTCIDFSTTNQYLLYTSSLPGTRLHFWDTRYTTRGLYSAQKSGVSNFSCVDLQVYKNNVYSKNQLSQFYKSSQKLQFSSSLSSKTAKSYCGSISYSCKYDVLFTSLHDGVYFSERNRFEKIHSSENVIFDGCVVYQDTHLILNNTSTLMLYTIKPELLVNKK